VAGTGSELTVNTLPDSVAYDVTATLKQLGQIDPALRRAATARMKSAAKPLVQEARSLVPSDSGLNWYNWTTESPGLGKPGTGRVIGPYNPTTVRRGIKVTYKGPTRRNRDRVIFPLLTLQNTSAAGAIFDIAGRANGAGRNSEGEERGRAMIDKLRKQGRASRIVWEAAERKMDEVNRGVQKAVADMEQEVQKGLK